MPGSLLEAILFVVPIAAVVGLLVWNGTRRQHERNIHLRRKGRR